MRHRNKRYRTKQIQRRAATQVFGEGGRVCHKCSKPYRRRNLLEVWEPMLTSTGLLWVKHIIKICVHCSGRAHAERMRALAERPQITVEERKLVVTPAQKLLAAPRRKD